MPYFRDNAIKKIPLLLLEMLHDNITFEERVEFEENEKYGYL